MSEYYSALDQICPALGLGYIEQDWGITFADRSRIGEFICFYRSHPELRWLSRMLLFELILASISEALEAGVSFGDIGADVTEFVREESRCFADSLKYWQSLAGNKWKISAWLESLFGPAGA